MTTVNLHSLIDSEFAWQKSRGLLLDAAVSLERIQLSLQAKAEQYSLIQETR